MTNAIFCLASSEIIASNIVSQLKSAAFQDSDIAVQAPNALGKIDRANQMQDKSPDGEAAGAAPGLLMGMGISDVDTKRYENKVKEGRTLIRVQTDDAGKRATVKKIFKNEYATDIAESNAPQSTICTAKPNVVLRNTAPQPTSAKDMTSDSKEARPVNRCC